MAVYRDDRHVLADRVEELEKELERERGRRHDDSCVPEALVGSSLLGLAGIAALVLATWYLAADSDPVPSFDRACTEAAPPTPEWSGAPRSVSPFAFLSYAQRLANLGPFARVDRIEVVDGDPRVDFVGASSRSRVKYSFSAPGRHATVVLDDDGMRVVPEPL